MKFKDKWLACISIGEQTFRTEISDQLSIINNFPILCFRANKTKVSAHNSNVKHFRFIFWNVQLNVLFLYLNNVQDQQAYMELCE